jgi:hypothetical protein
MRIRRIEELCATFEKLAQELSKREEIEEQLEGVPKKEPKPEPSREEGPRQGPYIYDVYRSYYGNDIYNSNELTRKLVETAKKETLRYPYEDSKIANDPRIRGANNKVGPITLRTIYRNVIWAFTKDEVKIDSQDFLRIEREIYNKYKLAKGETDFWAEYRGIRQILWNKQREIISGIRERIIGEIEKEVYIADTIGMGPAPAESRTTYGRDIDINEEVPLDYLVLMRKSINADMSYSELWKALKPIWKEWDNFNLLMRIVREKYLPVHTIFSIDKWTKYSPEEHKKAIEAYDKSILSKAGNPALNTLFHKQKGVLIALALSDLPLDILIRTLNLCTNSYGVISWETDGLLNMPRPQLIDAINKSKDWYEFSERLYKILEAKSTRGIDIEDALREQDRELFKDLSIELKKIYLKKDFYEDLKRAAILSYNGKNNLDKLWDLLKYLHIRFGINGAKKILRRAIEEYPSGVRWRSNFDSYWDLVNYLVEKEGEAGAKKFGKILLLKDLVHDVVDSESHAFIHMLLGPINKFDLNSNEIINALKGLAIYYDAVYYDDPKIIEDIKKFKMITEEDLEHLVEGFRIGKLDRRDARTGKTIATMRALRGSKEIIERAKKHKKVQEVVGINYDLGGGFQFAALPDLDIEHLTVGLDTDCCQRMGAEGEEAAIDSMINPTAGVLVLRGPRGEVIAQSYFHWVPEGKIYILDNVETSKKEVSNYGLELEPLYARLAEHLLMNGAKEVLAGKGYSEINTSAFKTVKLPEDPRHFEVDDPYTDFDEDNAMDLSQPLFDPSEYNLEKGKSERREGRKDKRKDLTYRIEELWNKSKRRAA